MLVKYFLSCKAVPGCGLRTEVVPVIKGSALMGRSSSNKDLRGVYLMSGGGNCGGDKVRGGGNCCDGNRFEIW